ncbi:prephenate dehydrogenase/arogenate dehydrogenase family protein [Oceanicella sp. SM1341]|uniref:prephenate dehydrogenase/arogenate dehydrogenase family protein n=1 Tax=Oceanicella sp. SM1341 TaxID=1548889 RepID=UPI000E552ADC|nr:prephenate dehydrogenase/arogenate dehydrogenase family protein [Oceanicella sp. SM1341]
MPDHHKIAPDPLPRLGLLGYGAFGQLAARALRARFDIRVHDPSLAAAAAAAEAGLRAVSLAEAAACPVVVLAMPVPAFAAALSALAPLLRPGTLVVDVASVKEEPARLMQALLPGHVELLATHPMFGPQSAGDGGRAALAGLKVVLCPLRGRRWRAAAALLRGLGLKVIVTTPQEHDRQAALSQGLTHLLARALAGLDRTPAITTRSFDLLMQAIDMVRDDPPEIYEAVTRTNRHVAGLRDTLIEALRGDAPASATGTGAAARKA